MARSVQETNPPRGQFWVALEITEAFAESAGNEGWQGGPQEVEDASVFCVGGDIYYDKNCLDENFWPNSTTLWNCEL